MGAIVIFDGYCNFCDASVGFIMERDPKQYFQFTANQQESGIALLKQHQIEVQDVSTIYLVEGDKMYSRSEAALRIARRLTLPWNLFWGFIIVPAFLRDPIYNFIAKNRYRFFGKRDTCRLPTEAERARFI